MSKTAVPVQFFGIGDVIFTMTIARTFEKAGYSIVWPVLPEYVKGLARAYPGIAFEPYDTNKHPDWIFTNPGEVFDGETRYLPLRFADQMLNRPYTECMQAKYALYNLDWHTWKTGAVYQRDQAREESLLQFLGITDTEPFAFVNRRFRSDFAGHAPFEAPHGLRIIEMQMIPGYSLFDWSAVLERAAEIHTVSTSLLYLLELMPMRCQTHLYPRRPEETDLRNVYNLLTKPYILHT